MRKAVSQISLQDNVEQKRQLNELNLRTHLLPMQLQAKPQNSKFGISNKVYTQASESQQIQSLRTQATKYPFNSERVLYDLDASMIYVHKERVEAIDELSSDKLHFLLREVQKKVPYIFDRVQHFVVLAKGNSDNKTLLVSQFQKIMEGAIQVFDEKAEEINKLLGIIRSQKEQLQTNNKVVEEQLQFLKMKEKDLLNPKPTGKALRANELSLINVQLEKRIEYLNQTIQNLLQQSKDSVAAKLQAKVEELTKQIENEQIKYQNLSNQNIQYTQQIASQKSTELKYQIQLKNLEERIDSLDGQLKQQIYRNWNLQDELDQTKEMLSMSIEDYLSLKYSFAEERKNMQRTYDKIRMLQSRIDEMTVKRSKQIDGPLDDRTDVDRLAFQQVIKIVDQDHVFQRYMMSSFQKNVQDYDTKLVDAYVDVKRLVVGRDQEAELQTLRYNFPPFSSYLDNKIIELELPFLPTRPLDNIFMGQLRAIMDGMYTEFKRNKYCSFQAYVLSWLSNFTIQNHRVVKLPPETKRVKIEEHIHTFYLDLQVPRLNKVWEVLQFRHFLNDIYSLEELYFYLHVRFQLRRGPWIEQFDAIYGVVHYMKLSQAEVIVQRYIQNFDLMNQKIILKALSDRRIEGKKNRQLVQTGFVLQLLLEMFRIDRNNRYKILTFAFPAQPLTFRAFHKFLKGNYANCTEAEVGDLWREIVMISNGIPNVNSFFIAAQDLFIRSLKLPDILPLPELDDQKKLSFSEGNFTAMKLVEALRDLKKDDLDKLTGSLVTLQSEAALQDAGLFSKLGPLKNNPIVYLQKTIPILLNDYVTLLVNANVEEDGCFRKSVEVEASAKLILGLVSEIRKQLDKQHLHEKDQNVRISRFQRYARKKVRKIYVIMSSVLQARLKQ